MSKVRHVALVISAVSLMGLASVSLASTNCSTTISQSTATCLSNAADAAFQANYKAEYAKQKAGLSGAYYSPASNNSSSNRNTNAYYSPPQQEQPSTNTISNDNSKKSRSSIRWF